MVTSADKTCTNVSLNGPGGVDLLGNNLKNATKKNTNPATSFRSLKSFCFAGIEMATGKYQESSSSQFSRCKYHLFLRGLVRRE